MFHYRKTFIAGLLACASAVVVLAVIDWVVSARPRFEPNGGLIQNLLVLFLCGAGTCVLAIMIFYAALRLAIFAAQRGHTGPLEIFGRFAPTLTRRLLGSIVGTSLALSGTGFAQAATVVHPQVSSFQAGRLVALPNSEISLNTQPRANVPTPGWMPGSMSIQLNRLMGSGKEHNRPAAESDVVIVTSGQTLWSIAQQMLNAEGSTIEISKLWPQIYEMNREVIGEDPNMLQLGIELKLPVID